MKPLSQTRFSGRSSTSSPNAQDTMLLKQSQSRKLDDQFEAIQNLGSASSTQVKEEVLINLLHVRKAAAPSKKQRTLFKEIRIAATQAAKKLYRPDKKQIAKEQKLLHFAKTNDEKKQMLSLTQLPRIKDKHVYNQILLHTRDSQYESVRTKANQKIQTILASDDDTNPQQKVTPRSLAARTSKNQKIHSNALRIINTPIPLRALEEILNIAQASENSELQSVTRTAISQHPDYKKD